MPITTLTNLEFSLDIAHAKRAASTGPVVITDHGKPSLVLLTYERYLALSHGQSDIVDRLGMPEAAEVDMHLPKAVLAGKRAQLR